MDKQTQSFELNFFSNFLNKIAGRPVNIYYGVANISPKDSQNFGFKNIIVNLKEIGKPTISANNPTWQPPNLGKMMASSIEEIRVELEKIYSETANGIANIMRAVRQSCATYDSQIPEYMVINCDLYDDISEKITGIIKIVRRKGALRFSYAVSSARTYNEPNWSSCEIPITANEQQWDGAIAEMCKNISSSFRIHHADLFRSDDDNY